MFKFTAPYFLQKFSYPTLKEDDKKHVYLLGQGWFSKGFMDNIDLNRYKVTNIYKDEITNVGQLDKIIPFNYPIKYIKTTIKDIDVCNNIIFTDNEHYDFTNNIVVCALGDNTPVKQWTKAIPDVSDYGIVGAGLVGTEMAFRLIDKGKTVTLIDGVPSILTFLPMNLKLNIHNRFKQKNILLYLNTMYKAENHNFDHTVFAIGSRPNDLTRNWIQTRTLQLKENPNVFFGGNCVWNTQIIGLNLPTAQQAYDQGKHVANSLNTEITEYKVKNFIYAIYIGDGLTALYMNNSKYYIIIPTCLLNIYYKIKYGSN